MVFHTRLASEKVHDATAVVAAHAKSQENIAKLRKRAIGQVLGIEAGAGMEAKAVDFATKMNSLTIHGAMEEKSQKEESQTAEKLLGWKMASELLRNMHQIKRIAETTYNTIDLEIANGKINEILEMGKKFGISLHKLPRPIIVKEEEGMEKATTMSQDMLEALQDNLERMESVAQDSEKTVSMAPASETIKKVLTGDRAVIKKQQQIIQQLKPATPTTARTATKRRQQRVV